MSADTAPAKKVPVCPHCGSENIMAVTSVEWSVDLQEWVVTESGIGESEGEGECFCGDCEEDDFDPTWKEVAAA